jgi:hypothetical protein
MIEQGMGIGLCSRYHIVSETDGLPWFLMEKKKSVAAETRSNGRDDAVGGRKCSAARFWCQTHWIVVPLFPRRVPKFMMSVIIYNGHHLDGGDAPWATCDKQCHLPLLPFFGCNM